MESIIGFILIAAFFLSLLDKPPPPKSVEQELGEVIGKYLAKGIKVNVELGDREQP
jgi:hypothetical protein